eukprot:scaffold67124_cov39-Phaeocystis_antarctica.AAC.1
MGCCTRGQFERAAAPVEVLGLLEHAEITAAAHPARRIAERQDRAAHHVEARRVEADLKGRHCAVALGQPRAHQLLLSVGGSAELSLGQDERLLVGVDPRHAERNAVPRLGEVGCAQQRVHRGARHPRQGSGARSARRLPTWRRACVCSQLKTTTATSTRRFLRSARRPARSCRRRPSSRGAPNRIRPRSRSLVRAGTGAATRGRAVKEMRHCATGNSASRTSHAARMNAPQWNGPCGPACDNVGALCAPERNDALKPRSLATPLHPMGEIASASSGWSTQSGVLNVCLPTSG